MRSLRGCRPVLMSRHNERERMETSYYRKVREGRSLISDVENIYLHGGGYWIYSDDNLRTWHRITDDEAAEFMRLRDSQ